MPIQGLLGQPPQQLADPSPASRNGAKGGPEGFGGEGRTEGADERFMDNVFNIIYDEKAMPEMLAQLKSGQPVEELVNIATTILAHLIEGAEAAGEPIDTQTMIEGTGKILMEFASLAGKEGIHDFSEDEMKAAYEQIMGLFEQMQAGGGQEVPQVGPSLGDAPLGQGAPQGQGVPNGLLAGRAGYGAT